jgi:hypothetical protein
MVLSLVVTPVAYFLMTRGTHEATTGRILSRTIE